METIQNSTPKVKKTRLICEVAVITSIGILPSLLSSIVHILAHTTTRSALMSYHGLGSMPTTLRSLGSIAVILFTLGQAGDLNLLGLRYKVKTDSIIVLCTVFAWLVYSYHNLDKYLKLPDLGYGLENLILGVVNVSISATSQEMMFRGYTIPRLTQIFGSPWIAWGISSLVFGMWHMYQGAGGAFFSLIYGAILGLIFLRTRRLIPLIMIHTITNSVLFVLGSGYFQHRGL